MSRIHARPEDQRQNSQLPHKRLKNFQKVLETQNKTYKDYPMIKITKSQITS